MPNFESIENQIKELSEKINQEEVSLNLIQNSKTHLKLLIKPMYLVFLYIAVFMVELVMAILKHKYNPNWWLYIVIGFITILYIIYVVIMKMRQNKTTKEDEEHYLQIEYNYKLLLDKRKELFENFVSQTGGIILINSEDNKANYIWVENDTLTLVTLTSEINKEQIPLDDIKYISTDLKLNEYNKQLGFDSINTVDIPKSYIFTNNKSYTFTSQNYDFLVALMPDKELLVVLKNKK